MLYQIRYSSSSYRIQQHFFSLVGLRVVLTGIFLSIDVTRKSRQRVIFMAARNKKGAFSVSFLIYQKGKVSKYSMSMFILTTSDHESHENGFFFVFDGEVCREKAFSLLFFRSLFCNTNCSLNDHENKRKIILLKKYKNTSDVI